MEKRAEGGRDPTLVALAAGVGSRYGGLKQLEPIGPGGETLLEYSVFDALRAGFSKVVLVVRPETEALFRQALAQGMAARVPVAYVHQTLENIPAGRQAPPHRTKPWGTGQAVLVAEPQVEGPFAVINADDFYGAESFRALARFLARAEDLASARYAMVGFDLAETLSDSGSVSRALCQLDETRHLKRIVEVLEVSKHGDGGVYTNDQGQQVEIPGDAVVSMNLWGFTLDLFPELRCRFDRFLESEAMTDGSEFLVPEVVQDLVFEGLAEVEVLSGGGPWCGITYPKDRNRTAAMIESLIGAGEYPERLWS